MHTSGNISRRAAGYEEAAAQGLVAGVNAARVAAGSDVVTFPRETSYLGTLIDDLVTKVSSFHKGLGFGATEITSLRDIIPESCPSSCTPTIRASEHQVHCVCAGLRAHDCAAPAAFTHFFTFSYAVSHVRTASAGQHAVERFRGPGCC